MLALIAVRRSPEEQALWALVGLAYPISLTCWTAGMLWCVSSWDLRVLILPAIIGVSAWSLTELTVGGLGSLGSVGGTEAVVSEAEQWDVVSWNVRLFDQYGWRAAAATRDSMLQHMSGWDAEVVCLQECALETGPSAYVSAEALASKLDLAFHGTSTWIGPRGGRGYGVATFSRWPIVSESRLEFPGEPKHHCLMTDIERNGQRVRIFNVHLQSFRLTEEAVAESTDREAIWAQLSRVWSVRAQQAEAVAEAVAASPYPVVLCGDFNDTPVSYARWRFVELLDDAFIGGGSGLGATYNGKIPGMRIDYILHDPHWTALEFERIHVPFSDHFPIRAILGLAD